MKVLLIGVLQALSGLTRVKQKSLQFSWVTKARGSHGISHSPRNKRWWFHFKGLTMDFGEFRIESNHPIANRFLPQSRRHVFNDPSLAVAIAAKCVPNSFGDEVRVVHWPSGEVIFRAVSPPPAPGADALNSVGLQ